VVFLTVRVSFLAVALRSLVMRPTLVTLAPLTPRTLRRDAGLRGLDVQGVHVFAVFFGEAATFKKTDTI
jgi:hypothetical protein